MARMSARLKTVPLRNARVTDRFWSEWQENMARTGIPHQWRQCVETGRLENLRRCARGESGGFVGYRFNDSDVYKLLEATSFAFALGMGDHLLETAGEAIDLVAAAQMPYGYINSCVQLSFPSMRWRSLNAMHEMYCIGHLIEAGVAHFEATGKTRLLDVARRAAEHVMSQFPLGGSPVYGDHQEIEIALARLASATGDGRYLEYAAWQTSSRGSRPSPFEAELEDPEIVALTPGVKALYTKDGAYDGAYAQDDMPLAQQTRAVGHAVRAMYFYAGAVDSLERDETAMDALRRIWNGLVSKQMYVTGGIGSSGRNEGFTDDYDLPNLDAYSETCAGIGLVYWAWRMFCVDRDAKYIDVLERALYNAVLSGVSPSCDQYFYDNPLESDGRHERKPWFACACCPPNIARLIMSIGQYALVSGDASVFVAIPIRGSYKTNAAEVEIDGDYPWSGDYTVRVIAATGLRRLALRVPSWSTSFTVTVNGQNAESHVENGFLVIDREWAEGDEVTVACPAEPRWVRAHPSVLSCAGRVALQCGPLVYCLTRSGAPTVPHHFVVDPNSPVRQGRQLSAKGRAMTSSTGDLYNFDQQSLHTQASGSFIPYYTWADAGPTTMQVWLRDQSRIYE
jgi:DUF1680 family protein